LSVFSSRHDGAGCRAKVLAACPKSDILVNNAGEPPPGDSRGRDDALVRNPTNVSPTY
jgi:hypothetical protein